MTSRRSPVNFRANDYAPPAPSVAEQLAGTLFDPRPLPTERRPEVEETTPVLRGRFRHRVQKE